MPTAMLSEPVVSEQSAGGSAAPSNRHILEMLMRRAREDSRPAATHKTNGHWVDVTWAELLDQVRAVSAGLVAMGVASGDRVAVFATTSLHWVVCDLAIAASRAVCVPIYGSNTPDEIEHVLKDSGSKVVIVDNDVSDGKQPGRLSRLRSRVESSGIEKVIIIDGAASGAREMTLAQLMALGKAEATAQFDARVLAVTTSDLSHILYTSGTTGNPKGVMLTHANWVYAAHVVPKVATMDAGDSLLLFLPLAHSFAQVVKSAWFGFGFRMIFAEAIDKVVANLAETQPTILPSVPRVFEKVFAGVQAKATEAPGLKGALAKWAFGLFDEYADARIKHRSYNSVSWWLAQRLVFSKVRKTVTERLGGKMRLFISGGAPLSPKIAYFFDLLGFQVFEGFGITETAALTSVNYPGKNKIGTVGPVLPGTEVKIAPDGEILIRGPSIMRGYYRNEAATAEVLDSEGWYHSGDIGELDSEGFLRITDRKKDIIVTAGGKNIAPQNLENTLKTFPIISTAMVHGDKRPYLTALICISDEVARKLTGAAPSDSYASLVERQEVRAAVQHAVDQLNSNQPPYATLKRFALMDHDFTQETGEITPTLKVKRKFCNQKYQSILDGLYDERRVD